MELLGVCSLNSLVLIASLLYATANQHINHIKDDFKRFYVISDTYGDVAVVDQECSASECNTLAYFMNHSTGYFKSNELY